MGARVVLAIGLTAIVAAVPAAGVGQGAVAAPRARGALSRLPAGQIVFTRARGSARPGLYVMATDGSDPRLLAPDASGAAVSPRGDAIAFRRGNAIWTMRRDGSRQRQVTHPSAARAGGRGALTWDDDAAWSPGGSTLYFVRYLEQRGDLSSALYAIRRDGGGLHRITHPAATPHGPCQAEPAPSPNGKIIVFSETDDCVHGLSWALGAVTTSGRGTRVPFGPASAVDGSPTWSPDGGRLAWSAYDLDPDTMLARTASSGLYVQSVGVRQRRIVAAKGPGEGFFTLAWSRDGAWIAFARRPFADARADIWLVHPDGTGLRRLTRTGVDSYGPAWLPSA